MTVAATLGALRGVILDLERGHGKPAEIAQLLEQTEEVARNAEDAQRAALLNAVGDLEGAILNAMSRISENLQTVGTRRTALSQYGSLRGHGSSQNLRTRI